jgi:hypothetical protein
MADADDVRQLALALPDVAEIESDGFDFRVADKGFVWSYPERRPGKPRVIRTDIAVLYVGDEAEKQALLLASPRFSSPHLPTTGCRSSCCARHRWTSHACGSLSPTHGGCVTQTSSSETSTVAPIRRTRIWGGQSMVRRCPVTFEAGRRPALDRPVIWSPSMVTSKLRFRRSVARTGLAHATAM